MEKNEVIYMTVEWCIKNLTEGQAQLKKPQNQDSLCTNHPESSIKLSFLKLEAWLIFCQLTGIIGISPTSVFQVLMHAENEMHHSRWIPHVLTDVQNGKVA